jgi:Zn-dependent protease with chaperone function
MSSPSPPPARLLYGPIRFHGPQSRSRAVSGARFFALYTVAVGVWALAAGWNRQPVLSVLAALFYLQVALSGVRGSMLVGDVVYDESQVRRIAPPLFELCGRANCQPPTVVVRNDRIRGAAVRASQGEKQLVLSGVLVDRLNDRQLRAIVAHEVAHLASGDLTRVRRRAVTGVTTGLAGAVLIGVLIGYRSEYSPLYGAGFLLALLLSRFPLSLMNRRLEVRADEKGAVLAADPGGEAEALTIADALLVEARREIASSYWRYLLFLSPLRWRLPSHPSITERLARLDRLDVGTNVPPTFDQSGAAPYAPGPAGQWSTRIASPPEADVSASSSGPQPPNSEWATRPGEPVGWNRRTKLLPLLLIAIAAIVFVVLPLEAVQPLGLRR